MTSVLSTAKAALNNIAQKFVSRKGTAVTAKTQINTIKSMIAPMESGLRFDAGSLASILRGAQKIDAYQAIDKASIAQKKAADIMANLGMAAKQIDELIPLLTIAEDAVSKTAAGI